MVIMNSKTKFSGLLFVCLGQRREIHTRGVGIQMVCVVVGKLGRVLSVRAPKKTQLFKISENSEIKLIYS